MAGPHGGGGAPHMSTRELLESRSVREGWLTKVTGVLQVWKRRYVVLRHGLLSYYKDEVQAVPKGVIDLNEATAVRPAHGDESDRPHSFVIVTRRRTFVFQAHSRADHDQWVSALALAHATRRVPGAPPVRERRMSDTPALLPSAFPSSPPDTPASTASAASSSEAGSGVATPTTTREARTRSRAASLDDSAPTPRAAAAGVASPPHSASVFDDDVVARVRAFYELNCPAKANEEHIARVLRHYAMMGPDRMFTDLHAKYRMRV
uniref:PH domain-containing protein n=1 Tax=Bicosoecida sp. CB-2014 TaxID=1486930 RepID=A0A7S1CL31_9STRA